MFLFTDIVCFYYNYSCLHCFNACFDSSKRLFCISAVMASTQLLAHPVQEMPEWERWEISREEESERNARWETLSPKRLFRQEAALERRFLVLFVGSGSCSCWLAEISSIHPPQRPSSLLIWGPGKGEQNIFPGWGTVPGKVQCRRGETLTAQMLLPCPVRTLLCQQRKKKNKKKKRNKAARLLAAAPPQMPGMWNASQGNSSSSRKTGKEDFDTFWAVGVGGGSRCWLVYGGEMCEHGAESLLMLFIMSCRMEKKSSHDWNQPPQAAEGAARRIWVWISRYWRPPTVREDRKMANFINLKSELSLIDASLD